MVIAEIEMMGQCGLGLGKMLLVMRVLLRMLGVAPPMIDAEGDRTESPDDTSSRVCGRVAHGLPMWAMRASQRWALKLCETSVASRAPRRRDRSLDQRGHSWPRGSGRDAGGRRAENTPTRPADAL